MRLTDPVWDDEHCPARGPGLCHIQEDDLRCPYCGRTCFSRGIYQQSTTRPVPSVRKVEEAHDPMADKAPPDNGTSPDPDPALPGVCVECRKIVARTWPLPVSHGRVCSKHLLAAMQRATWPHSIRRIPD